MFSDQDTRRHNIDFTTVRRGDRSRTAAVVAFSSNGDSVTLTLTTPGTYSYVCDYHAWMKGTITVTG